MDSANHQSAENETTTAETQTNIQSQRRGRNAKTTISRLFVSQLHSKALY
jgi:hypothetical protein